MRLPTINGRRAMPAVHFPTTNVTNAPLSAGQHRALLSSRRLAKAMDSQWGAGPVRFGLETLLDLIPGVGDVVSLGVSLYQLGVARQLGVSRGRRIRMGLNVGIDAIAGSVPIIGDLADTAFKAHARNQRIIDDYVEHKRAA